MERFCKDLKEHTVKIMNYDEKKMVPLTQKQNKSCKEQKVCYACKKGFSNDDYNKNIIMSEIIVIILENLEELLRVFVI